MIIVVAEKRRDEELVQAHLAGEAQAFDRVVERYQPRLIGFALKRLKNYADAEDAVGETWLTVCQKIRDYQPTRKFSSWLYGICLNKCYEELKKRHPKFVPLSEDVYQLPEGKGKLYEAARDKVAREWCLAVLNHRQHRLYNLVMVQGRPYEAILQEEKEFCPVPPEVPLEIKPEHIEKLRQEFAEIMEIVYNRHKERIRRDREAARKE